MKKIILLSIGILLTQLLSAQLKSKDLDALSLQYAKASFDELATFFSLPNDANYPEQIEPNVLWCEQAFAKRGFATERIPTETVPLLLATRMQKKAKKVVIFSYFWLQ